MIPQQETSMMDSTFSRSAFLKANAAAAALGDAE